MTARYCRCGIRQPCLDHAPKDITHLDSPGGAGGGMFLALAVLVVLVSAAVLYASLRW